MVSYIRDSTVWQNEKMAGKQFVTIVSHNRGDQKKGLHSGPIMWASYFELWVAGPHNFPCFNRHRVPHFLQNLKNFSRFTRIFQALALFTTIDDYA